MAKQKKKSVNKESQQADRELLLPVNKAQQPAEEKSVIQTETAKSHGAEAF